MKKALIALGLAIALAGCDVPAPSLHPLIPSDQATVLKGLEGSWAEDEAAAQNGSGTVWTFEAQNDHSYKLKIFDADQDSAQIYTYTANVTTLGGRAFLDVVLKETTARGEKMDFDGMAIPTHMFGRIELQGDQLHIGLLNEEWLRKEWQENRANLPHETLGEDFLLTASTQELQQFAIQSGWDEQAFGFTSDLWRRVPEVH